MRILITGADGFVGRHLSGALLSAGYALTLAVRKDTGQFNLGGDVRIAAVGNINKHTDWHAALSDVDCVINLSGRAHILKKEASDPKQTYMDVNCFGAERLFYLSGEAGIGKFIHLSSAHVLGMNSPPGLAFNDKSKPVPANDYAASKWEGEQALLRLASAQNGSLVILRPPLIVGAGAKGNLHRLLRWVKKPIPIPLAGLNNRRSLLSIENLVSAIEAVLAFWVTQPCSGTYLVDDNRVISTSEILDAIRVGMNGRAWLLSIPNPVLLFLLRGIGGNKMVRQLTGDLELNSGLFQQDFSWCPEVNTVDSLVKMAKEFSTPDA